MDALDLCVTPHPNGYAVRILGEPEAIFTNTRDAYAAFCAARDAITQLKELLNV